MSHKTVSSPVATAASPSRAAAAFSSAVPQDRSKSMTTIREAQAKHKKEDRKTLWNVEESSLGLDR